MKQNWLMHILRRPGLFVLLLVVLSVLAGVGAKNLYFRGDYKVFFEETNPQRQAFTKMQQVFNKNENAAIIVVPHSGDVFNPETLELLQSLTDAAWQTPFSTRVDSITNFQHTWSEDDDLMVQDMLPKDVTLDSSQIAEIKHLVMQEPELKGRLVSPSGHVAMVNVTVVLPDGDQTIEVGVISQYVRGLSAQFKAKYPDHDFYETGMVLLNNAFTESATQDATTLVPLMFLTIIVVLWLMLRTWAGMLGTVIVVVITIVTTIGLSGWMGMFLSTATVNVPTIVMTLAVADCIHIIASTLLAMSRGMEKQAAIRYAVKLNQVPVWITSITTAIGFVTLNFSEVPVLADLGNLCAIGVMLACILSLTLLPAMLSLLPLPVRIVTSESTLMARFGGGVTKYYKVILPSTLVLAVVAGLLTTQNRLNDISTEYFAKSTQFRQASDFQEANLSGNARIDFAIYTGKESGINAPEVIQTIENFAIWLRQQAEVDHVVSISDTFKRLNKNMHGDDETFYRLPREQELAAQYLLLFEMSLPYGLDLNNQLNLDKSATRMSVTMKNLGSKEFTEFEQRAKNWFDAHSQGLTIEAASPNLMFAHIGEANMKSLIQGTLVALVLISLLLIFALRSLKLGLISLVPNLLPALLGFGIWGAFSGQINMALSVVLSMTLGIIVDDTVHFLSKYKHARTEQKNAAQSIEYAFSTVGKALITTTVVLSLGFFVLTLSPFALNADMGMLTGIIIVVALLVDLLFLPAFLLLIDRKSHLAN